MAEWDDSLDGRASGVAVADREPRGDLNPWDAIVEGHRRSGGYAANGASTQARPHRWRPNRIAIGAGVFAFLGLIVFLYPDISSWFSQVNQSKITESYSAQVEVGIVPTAAEQLAVAHQYNDALSAGALLEAGERLPTSDGESSNDQLDYWKILRVPPDGVMARLRFDAIGVDLPIFHGTADATLEKGIGHLEGTSLPVGGAGTRSVLTAHRGLANATMFTNLNRAKIGDTFTIEVMGQMLTYRVFDQKVVAPDETEALRAVPGRDLVTLVTCTPLGINTHRILVTGERVIPTPIADAQKVGSKATVPTYPWWVVFLVMGLIAVVGYEWYAGLPPRRRGRRRATTHPLRGGLLDLGSGRSSNDR